MSQDKLVIAIMSGDGNIKYFQPYEEFIQGSRNLPILNLFTGQKLFDILVDEVGVIRYEDNKFALKIILEANNPINTAMKLLGKVAEAVIVRRCHEDMDINKKWLSLARRKKTKIKTAEKFTAYGTGLLSTKSVHEKRYNISDPQRDVIWLDENGQVAMMNGSSNIAGLEAGLQIKVSQNGAAYFLNDLINIRYEVPVVYFDICNDFDSIAEKLYLARYTKKIDGLIIGEDFIKASAIDYNAYNEVLFYVDLIKALIDGKITPEQLIYSEEIKNDATLKSAILSTSLSEISLPNLLIV